MKKITPSLWFDELANEPIHFYITIFDHATGNEHGRFGSAQRNFPLPERQPEKGVTFELAGQEFVALPGLEGSSFAPAISFAVNCASQEEADALWEKLATDGEEKDSALRQAIARIRGTTANTARAAGRYPAGLGRRSGKQGTDNQPPSPEENPERSEAD